MSYSKFIVELNATKERVSYIATYVYNMSHLIIHPICACVHTHTCIWLRGESACICTILLKGN